MGDENYSGTISKVFEKGFGFIQIEGIEKGVFFHAKDVRHVRFDQLRAGDKVTIGQIQTNDKGQVAKNVYLVT